MNTMEIRTEDLSKVIKVLSGKLEKSFDKIELTEDYYWEILLEEELYDPGKDLSELGLGQLSDDWNELKRLKYKDTAVTEDLEKIGCYTPFYFSRNSPVVW